MFEFLLPKKGWNSSFGVSVKALSFWWRTFYSITVTAIKTTCASMPSWAKAISLFLSMGTCHLQLCVWMHQPDNQAGRIHILECSVHPAVRVSYSPEASCWPLVVCCGYKATDNYVRDREEGEEGVDVTNNMGVCKCEEGNWRRLMLTKKKSFAAS